MLQKVKSKYWQQTHKYRVRIPKLVEEAHRIDKENGDSMWADTIKKQMPKIIGAVEEHDDDMSKLVGYQQILGHLIFDVKLGENFRRKARFAAHGHKTEVPPSVTYSNVVSRESK